MYDDHEFIAAVEEAVAKRHEQYGDAENLLDRVQSFKLEGATFWASRFEADSMKGQWNEGMYGEGDEDAPFFSEAFLYNLVGKDEARSILGIVRQLLVMAGLPESRVRQQV